MPDTPQGPPAGPLPGPVPNDPLASQRANMDKGMKGQADLQKAADKFQKSIFRRVQNGTIKPGSLVVFQYNFFKHDPSPLCLVSRVNLAGDVSGINLHYLTFRYVQQLVKTYCGKAFNYRMVKGNKYIVNAYRSYKRAGRRNVQVLDSDFLLSVLGSVKSFKPSELEAIRQSVQRQLREKMHPTAEDVAKQYQEHIRTQDHKNFGLKNSGPDGRKNPTDLLPPDQGVQG